MESNVKISKLLINAKLVELNSFNKWNSLTNMRTIKYLLFQRQNIQLKFNKKNYLSNLQIGYKNVRKYYSYYVTIDNINVCLDYNRSYCFYITTTDPMGAKIGFFSIKKEYLRFIYQDTAKLVISAEITGDESTVYARGDFYKPCQVIFYPLVSCIHNR